VSTTPAEPDEETTAKVRRAEQQAATITAFVMRALGRPPDLFRVTVVRLWRHHFRVNVQTGTDVTSARIAHSYFLAVDESGQVIASDPAIARQY
jgi:hypothetical protein